MNFAGGSDSNHSYLFRAGGYSSSKSCFYIEIPNSFLATYTAQTEYPVA